MSMTNFIIYGWNLFNKIFEILAPFANLFIRYWLANVFLLSALTKIQSWPTTLALFKYEYHVPLLSPTLAAYSGTFVELVMPVFLLLGLGGRLPVFILFVFNIVAVFSYPFLFTQEGAVGLKDHIYWGMLLLVPLCYGYDKLSLDNLLCWVYKRKCQKTKKQ